MVFSVSVPNVPGVPSVNFSASTGSGAADLLVQDALNLFAGSIAVQPWGIYLGGLPVVLAETVTGFDFNRAWTINDYPVEQGGFESYDKVYTPFQGTFRFTTGGSLGARAAFLASVAAIESNLLMYDIVTPEAIYTGVNVVRVSYHRAAERDMGLVSVDVRVQEVRVSTGLQTDSATRDPQSAAQVNTGTVQATTTTTNAASADALTPENL